MGVVFVNGKFVEEGRISVEDSAFRFGYGVFETLRTYHGKLSNFSLHYERLVAGCKKLGIKVKHNKKTMLFILKELIRKNKLQNNRVRITVSRNNLVCTFGDLKRYTAKVYSKGVSVLLTNFVRTIPEVKHTSYLACIIASDAAKKKGYFEGLLSDGRGHVTEGVTTNLFIIKDGYVITPVSGMLLGITRKLVLSLLEKHKIPFLLKNIQKQELVAADELFLTNSTGEIIPVVKVDGRKIGDGKVGKVTKKVMKLYKDHIKRR